MTASPAPAARLEAAPRPRSPSALSRLARRPGLRPWWVPAALLLVWEVGAHAFGDDPRYFPSLESVAARGWRLFATDDLLGHVLASLERDLLGFALGAAAGVALGLALGLSVTLRRLLNPLLAGQRQIALYAWAPLLAMWFGGGETGKIVFIALAAFQPTLANTRQGVAEIPQGYRELSDVLLFSRWDFVSTVAIPGALPQIFTGLHTALIYAWTATIAAELLFNVAPGVGGQLVEGQQLFQMDRLIACLMLLGGVGVIFNLIARALERRWLRGRTA